MEEAQQAFALVSIAASVCIVIAAEVVRSRFYAVFCGIVLAIHTFVSVAMWPTFVRVWPLYAYLQAMVYAHYVSLVWPRARSAAWRRLVSIPALFFAAGTFIALPWGVVSALGVHPYAWFVPYALAFIGVVQSIVGREEEIHIELDGKVIGDEPVRYPRGKASRTRPLRVFQITDPHIGPFMPVSRLRRICERAVERNPDLVVVTGDLLTMESQSDPNLLADAFEPLRALSGRVFACRGNHDLEAPATVSHALERAGVQLLIDEEAVVETEAGAVQILGIDYRWRGRKEHLETVCARYPRHEGHLRIVLLHDPGAFKHLPPGEGDLVFSGHTHGGQLGLVSLGLPWTVLGGLSRVPDHGFWARGRDRLYVHRGTGHYGFPLRLGVPSEQSLLNVHLTETADST